MSFLTPAERRRIDAARQGMARQRQSVRQQVEQHQLYSPEVMANRMLEAADHLPTAPSWMHSLYAVGDVSMEQIENLAMKHQQTAVQDTAAEGFFGKLGSALHSAWFGTYDQVVKPAVRAGVLAIDTIAQEALQRPGTAVILGATDSDLSIGEAYTQYGPSTGVQAATDVAQGRGLDLGEGFFPGGGAHERGPGSRELEIRGEPATFGGAVVEGQTRTAEAVGGALGIPNLSAATPAMGASFLVESMQSPEKGWQLVQDVVGGDDPGQAAFEKASGLYQMTADIALDPTMWGARGAAHLIRGAKGIDAGHRTLGSAIRATSQDMADEALDAVEAAGLISGSRRNTVLLERAQHMFKHPKLLKTLSEADEYDLYRNLRLDRIQHRPGSGLDDFVKDLAGMSDETEIANYLLNQVSAGYIYERGFYQGVGRFNAVNPRQWWKTQQQEGWFRGTETRYGGLNPEKIVSIDDRMGAAANIDDWLRLGKVTVEDRRAIFKDVLHADSNAELLQASARGAEKMLARLEAKPTFLGTKEIDHVKEWKSIVESQINGNVRVTRTYARKEGENLLPPWAKATNEVQIPKADGTFETVMMPAAGMVTDGMQTGVNLLDPQTIRRATTDNAVARALYQSNGWGEFEKFTRFITARVFKPLALFTRPSYTVRNNVDNNLRMAGAGFSSMFSPDGYFAALNANRKGMFDMAFSKAKHVEENTLVKLKNGHYARIDGIDEAGEVTGSFLNRGERFSSLKMSRKELEKQMESTSNIVNESYKQIKVLTDSASGMHFKNSNTAAYLNSFRPFRKGVDEQYLPAWRDELIRMNSDPVYAAYTSNEFATRKELVDHLMQRRLGERIADTLGAEADAFLRPGGAKTVSRQRMEAYLDEYVIPHIEDVTANNPELVQAINTGRLANGARITSDDATARLGQDLFQFGPHDVRGSAYLSAEPGARSAWEESIGFLAEWAASRPENFFTRYPLMTQVWADDMARSMKSLKSDALRNEVIERAISVGMPKQQVEILKKAAGRARGRVGPVDDLEAMIQATKFHAADKTREIAFDATRRGSFQEAFDAWAPFYDAWAEVATSWGKIVRDNPNVFVRGTNTYRALRTQGTFTTDEFGQEVFQYPGGGVIAALLGLENAKMVPVGSVAGLNMIVQGIGPGFGPVVQWPAGAFIPEDPDWQWVRDFVLPFGSDIRSPDDLLIPKNYASNIIPAWAEKTFNALTSGGWDEHQWNTMVGHSMAALGTAEGHKYDMTSVEGMQAFKEDAIKNARWALLFRSFQQWGMPTGPRIEWDIKADPDGEWHRMQSIASLYFDMLEQSGGDEQVASALFTEMIGVEPYWVAQGSTRQIVPAPRTQEGQDWIARNKEAASAYPEVISYFTPAHALDAPPNYNVIKKLMDEGKIQSLDADQRLGLVRMNQAYAILNGQRERLSHLPPGKRNEALGVVRGWLDEKFPGWNAGIPGLQERHSREFRIQRLEEAAFDPDLEDAAVTKPLRVYLQKRREAYDVIERRGGPSGMTAVANEDVREWLHSIGQEISVTDPQFRGVWTSLLSWEVSN